MTHAHDEHVHDVAPAGPAARARADAATSASGLLHLQRTAGNGAVAQVLSRPGNPLEPDVRAEMENHFGHDFSDVRVHTDAAAGESARAINANAYTAGSHIVFQRDQYAPHTDACRRTLAHELTHVLQQKAGPVDGTPTDGGLRLSHPDDRFEREATATAERVVQEQAIQRRVDGEDNEEAEQ